MINVVIFIILWVLTQRNYAVMQITEDTEYALSILIGFIVITSSKIFTGRYFESGGLLIQFHQIFRQLSLMLHLYGSGKEGEDRFERGNVFWRKQAKKTLISFLKDSMDILIDPESCEAYTLGSKYRKKSQNNMINSDDSLHKNPSEVLKRLASIISKQNDLLVRPMHPKEEMVLHGMIPELHTNLDLLYKIHNTPVPFALLNLIRICVGSWILVIPFLQKRYLIINFIFVFFLTYAVIGIDVVANEFSDPFGDDPNDFDVHKFTKVRTNMWLRKSDVYLKLFSSFVVSKGSIIFVERFMNVNYNPFKPCFRDILSIEAQLGRKYQYDVVRSRIPSEICTIAQNDDFSKYLEQRGQNELRLGQYDAALISFSAAVDAAPSNTDSLFYGYEAIGDIHMLKESYVDAIDYYQQSIIVGNKLYGVNRKIGKDISQVKKKVGNLFFDTAQYQSALCCFEELNGELEWPSFTRHKVGLIHFYNGNTEEAKQTFYIELEAFRKQYFSSTYMKCVTEEETTNKYQHMCTLLYCLGLVHEEKAEYELAISCLTEALAMHFLCIDSHFYFELKVAILSSLGCVFAKEGDANQAQIWNDAARKISDSLNNGNDRNMMSNKSTNSWTVTKTLLSAKGAGLHR